MKESLNKLIEMLQLRICRSLGYFRNSLYKEIRSNQLLKYVEEWENQFHILIEDMRKDLIDFIENYMDDVE